MQSIKIFNYIIFKWNFKTFFFNWSATHLATFYELFYSFYHLYNKNKNTLLLDYVHCLLFLMKFQNEILIHGIPFYIFFYRNLLHLACDIDIINYILVDNHIHKNEVDNIFIRILNRVFEYKILMEFIFFFI